MRKFALVFAVCLALMSIPRVGQAQQVKLAIEPLDVPGAFFELDMAPGERSTLRVQLVNYGADAIGAVTFSADAYTIVNGGFGAKLRGEPRTGTALWVDYPETVMQLQSREKVVRSFDVVVPAQTPPGEYVSALVIQNDKVIKGSGNVAVDQINRQAIAVFIKVPGERHFGLEYIKAEHKSVAGRSTVVISLKNTSNALVKPEGPWQISDASGKRIAGATVAMDSFYAGNQALLELNLAQHLKPGRYSATLTLDHGSDLHAKSDPLPFDVGSSPRDGGDPSLTSGLAEVDASAVAGPSVNWLLVIPSVLTLIVALAIVFIVFVKRRKREESGPTSM